MHDGSERGAADAPAFDARALLDLWFENSPMGMTLADPDRRWFKINRAFADMLGYAVQELLESPDQSRFTHPDDVEEDRANIAALIAGDRAMARWDKRYIRADGRLVWACSAMMPLRDDDGRARVLIAQIEDITARREMEHRLDLAEHDSLTGLGHRATFERACAEQLARCTRYGERAALLLADLDGLKQINDTHGHGAGDDALKTVADALRQRLRASDLAARLGGDEFVVLLPHTTSAEAERIAEEIEEQIAHTAIAVATGVLHTTASIGAADIDTGTPDVQTALENADTSMYAAKRRRGRSPRVPGADAASAGRVAQTGGQLTQRDRKAR